MSKLMGFELLRKQTLDKVEENIAEILDDWAEGDSEIERLFHAAITLLIQHGFTENETALKASDPAHADSLRSWDGSRRSLIIERQVKIDQFRVDFVVSAWTYGRVFSLGPAPAVNGEPRWRKLIVECDGHDYHERTKEQAAKDRSRDRTLNGAGYDVFRFTGSELWRDPWGCAQQVYDWAARGLN